MLATRHPGVLLQLGLVQVGVGEVDDHGEEVPVRHGGRVTEELVEGEPGAVGQVGRDASLENIHIAEGTPPCA